MSVQQSTIKQVTKLVQTVRHRCELELPFTKKTIQKELSCSAVILHSITELGILVNGGGHGEDGNMKYKWSEKFAKTPNDKIVEMIVQWVGEYNSKYYKKGKSEEGQPEEGQPGLFNGEQSVVVRPVDVLNALNDTTKLVLQLIETNKKQAAQIEYLYNQFTGDKQSR